MGGFEAGFGKAGNAGKTERGGGSVGGGWGVV